MVVRTTGSDGGEWEKGGGKIRRAALIKRQGKENV
jgi:hypothetical protein